MARPIWKGHITFGLVNIPVTLFSAEKRNDIHFRMLDSRNNARVRYERVNEVTGEEVPWDKIVKAFEYDDGDYVLMRDEDFEKVAVEQTQSVEIEDFVDVESIHTTFFDKPYILVPGKKGEKGYVLLRETLRRTKKVGIAKVVIRTRQYLAALMAVDNALVLDLLRFHQELRDLDEFDLPGDKVEDYKVNDKEIKMAEQLVESMTSDWEPAQYKDEYREALMAWIEKKAQAEGEISPPEPVEETKPAGEIIDIMDLLKRSVKETGKRKKVVEPEEEEQEKEEKPPAKSKAKAKSKPKAKPKAKSKTTSPPARKKASGER
jgi:DNA end-binding protein Ku